MTKQPLISIITVNYQQAAVTAELLQSLSKLRYTNFEVIVVDNASAESADHLKVAFPFINYIASPVNSGFAGGNNLGLQYAKGEYVFFVNNDTEVTADLLQVLVGYMERHPKCGIACPKILFYHQPGVIQYAGSMGLHPVTSRSYDPGANQPDDGRFDSSRKTDLPHGAAMLVPMKVIKEAGTMSEAFFLYYEELDWGARIKACGYEIHYVGGASIFHKESVSTGRQSAFKTYYLYRNRLLYLRRNCKGWQRFLSIPFFLAISVPVHVTKHLLKGERQHALAILRGLGWHLSLRMAAPSSAGLSQMAGATN